MRNVVNSYVEKFKHAKQARRRMVSVIVAISLIVSCGVYWEMGEDGLAMANEMYCGQEEHVHGDECYDQVLVCGSEESDTPGGHVHDASCYESELICETPEHTHTVSCLIDETADIEVAEDWESTLPEELTGVWADDVVAIAESQIGYAESETNFQLAEDGETRQGYTRYGEWYGNAYGDWDAMFVSFCLYYANVPEDEFPQAAGAYAWIAELEQKGLYEDAADYEPVKGDLVFLDTNENEGADTVAIVTAVDDDVMTVVQGDSDDAVEQYTVSVDESAVVGYGLLTLDEESSEILPLMEGTGNSPFPVDGIYGLTVTWKNAVGETVYNWTRTNHVTSENNGNQDTIDALGSGTYTITIMFEDAGNPVVLYEGETYGLQLDWPTGEGISVAYSGGDDISGTSTDNNGNELFEYTINIETGSMTIKPIQLGDDSNFGITFTINLSNGNGSEGSETIGNPSIKKIGETEVEENKINWTITAVVPRYVSTVNNGMAYVWSIDDYEDVGWGGRYGNVVNDMTNVKVIMTSEEYSGGLIVPSLENAGENDPFAYYLQYDDDDEEELIFLNRCTCDEDNCAKWSDGCENKYQDTGFCSCWLYTFNATFTIEYSVDITEILQTEEENDFVNSINVTNYAELKSNNKRMDGDSAEIPVFRPFTKTESAKANDNEGVGTFVITINPDSGQVWDYTGYENLTIVDKMDNLAHFDYPAEVVKAGDTVLQRISEEEAADLNSINDQNKYYSVVYEAVCDKEGNRIGDTMTIKIWYPTNLTYTIEYRAFVIGYDELEVGETSSYSNTVTVDDVSYTVTGTVEIEGEDVGSSKYLYQMSILKVDADSAYEGNDSKTHYSKMIQGAVFDVYMYIPDEENDLYLTTLTTDENGSAVFHSNKSGEDGITHQVEFDCLYYFVETKAPDGYEKVDEKYYFYFFKNGYDGNLPVGIDEDEIHVGYSNDNGENYIEIAVENEKTPTYPVEIYKYFEAEDGTGYSLSGAEFILMKGDAIIDNVSGEEAANYYYGVFTSETSDEGDQSNSYVFNEWTEEREEATTLVSGTDGYIHIEGLEEGTYYLSEIKAPDGFNRLSEPVEIMVSSNKDNDGTGVISYEVENIKSGELPKTGGPGTTPFTVAGLTLIFGVGGCLIYRKKKEVMWND